MLDDTQRKMLADLVQQIRSEPFLSPQQVLDLLAQLVDDPDLGPGTISRAITTQMDSLLQRVAERAFLLGRQQQ